MSAGLNVVILAAGQGKRMRSRTAQGAAHPGRPAADRARARHRARAEAARICVVYGHGGEQVREAIAATNLAFVRQEPQLGTGHAVQQALPQLDDAGLTLVLYGDVPLIGAETLQR